MAHSENRTLRAATAWIKRQVYTTKRDGRCIKLILNHVTPTQKSGAEVFTIEVGEGLSPGEKIDDSAVDSYAADIVSEADNYTDGMGGTQSFTIGAVFEGDDRIVARHAFRCHRDDDGDSTVGSEPATGAGLMAQQMRHTEAVMRQNGAMFGTAISTLVKQNEMLAGMVETFMSTRVNELEAAEELISAKHQRDLDLRREEKTAQIQGTMVEHAMALLPAVANKMIGKKILPETTDTSLMALVKFAETLTPNQVQGLAANLDPAQQIAFFELLQTIQQRASEENNNPPNGQPS